jgi:hypothetical protein
MDPSELGLNPRAGPPIGSDAALTAPAITNVRSETIKIEFEKKRMNTPIPITT